MGPSMISSTVSVRFVQIRLPAIVSGEARKFRFFVVTTFIPTDKRDGRRLRGNPQGWKQALELRWLAPAGEAALRYRPE